MQDAELKHPRYAEKALKRLDGGRVLVRHIQPEAGGYLYSIEPGGRPFPKKSGDYLTNSNLLAPSDDGLFPGHSQTFRVAH